ncbi:hypothetical protein X975_12782, partial [Stegodyphus mimosarum]
MPCLCPFKLLSSFPHSGLQIFIALSYEHEANHSPHGLNFTDDIALLWPFSVNFKAYSGSWFTDFRAFSSILDIVSTAELQYAIPLRYKAWRFPDARTVSNSKQI